MQLDIALDKLEPSGDNARKEFEPRALAELAESIRTHGVLQPILVTKGTPGRWRIVAGERRYRAALLVGLKRIPAVIRERLNARQEQEIMLLENLQRVDLKPLETAAALQRLLDNHGYTNGQLAERLGKSASYVSQLLGLLELPADVQSRLRTGELTQSHAAALLPLASEPERCSHAARAIVGGGLWVTDAQNLVSRIRQAPVRTGSRSYREAMGDLRTALDLARDRGWEPAAALLDHSGPALLDALAAWIREQSATTATATREAA